MKLLLVGFSRREDAAGNDFWRSFAKGENEDFGDNQVVALWLPPVWDSCFEPLAEILEQSWDAVVCLAEKECEMIAVERLAINEADVSVKDSLGRRPRGKVIDSKGDAGYWTGLPFRDLAANLTTARFAAIPSHSAGTGLANYVFYKLMRKLNLENRTVVAGLIQIPEARPLSSKEEVSGFVSVLLDTLDPARTDVDSLKLDVAALESKFGVKLDPSA